MNKVNNMREALDRIEGDWNPLSPEAKAAAAAGTGRAVLIRVKNVPELVQKQGGGIGSALQKLAPATLETKVLDTMRMKLAEEFKKQGVDADVSVVASAGFMPAGSSPIWKPLAITFGSLGLAALIWKLVKR